MNYTRTFLLAALIATLCTIGTPAVRAQGTDPTSLQVLLQLIQSLQAQVQSLQAQVNGSHTIPPPPGTPPTSATPAQQFQNGTRSLSTTDIVVSQPLPCEMPLVQMGSQGVGVSLLQVILRRHGDYSGPVTGYFGPLTKAGVRHFQTASSLSVTGVVNAATADALDFQTKSYFPECVTGTSLLPQVIFVPPFTLETNS